MKKVTSTLALVLVLVCVVSLCFADTLQAITEPSQADTTDTPAEQETETNPTVIEPSIVMTDVDMYSEPGQDITKLINSGVINGYQESDGSYTFRPGNPVTRAEFCKMVNLTFDFNVMADNRFSDVSSQDWYYVHVLSAIHYGYIQGYQDGTFRGENLITREEVCTILSRILNQTAETKVEIKDEVSDWARPYVENIVALGYMPLEDGGKFRATEDMTRGELATTLADHVVEKSGPDTTIQIPTGNETEKEDDGDEDFSISPNQSSTDPKDSKEGLAGGTRPSRPGNGNNSGNNSGNSGNTGSDDNDDNDDNTGSGNTPEVDEEELYEQSEFIYDSLEYALEEIAEKEELEIFYFDEKGQEIFDFLKSASTEVVGWRDSGVIVSNEYVREVYDEEIIYIKGILDGMTTEERDAFEFEVNKLSAVVTSDLARIFNVNINYGKD